jgi:hypothetical protein
VCLGDRASSPHARPSIDRRSTVTRIPAIVELKSRFDRAKQSWSCSRDTAACEDARGNSKPGITRAGGHRGGYRVQRGFQARRRDIANCNFNCIGCPQHENQGAGSATRGEAEGATLSTIRQPCSLAEAASKCESTEPNKRVRPGRSKPTSRCSGKSQGK